MPKFYAGSHGALVLYSITDRNSFEAVKDWLEELKKHTDCHFLILVGTKSDLESQRSVSKSEGQEFAKLNDMSFMETSAKDNINVDAAFDVLIKEIFEDTTRTNSTINEKEETNEIDHNTVTLTPPKNDETKRSCRC